jgi:hypothetical protein
MPRSKARPGRVLLSILLFGLAAGLGGCDEAGSVGADAGGPTPDADPLAPDARPGTPDADTAEPDAAPPLPVCQLSCTAPSDCATPQSPLYDASHFQCQQSRCRWLGCRAGDNCTAVGVGYACATSDPLPQCLKTCTTAADCDLGNQLNDPDNFKCQGGFCRYQGCNSDDECASAFGVAYGCRLVPGYGTKSCQKVCTTAGDCIVQSPAYDLDNWTCESLGGSGAKSTCQWTGCRSTPECQSAFGNKYVCD